MELLVEEFITALPDVKLDGQYFLQAGGLFRIYSTPAEASFCDLNVTKMKHLN